VLLLLAPLPATARRGLVKVFDQLAPLATAAKYFTAGIAIFWVLTLREMLSLQRKIDRAAEGTELTAQLRYEVRLFRSQRNVYISGFAFLLLLVIYRLYKQLREVNQLTATRESLTRQAEGAVAAYKALAESKDALEKAAKENGSSSSSGEATKKPAEPAQKTEVEDELELANETIDVLRERNTKLVGDLEKANKDAEALKRQAEGLSTEYARLTREKESLENKLADFELVLGEQVKKSK